MLASLHRVVVREWEEADMDQINECSQLFLLLINKNLRDLAVHIC
jgi:hypothetical protein